MSAKRKKEKEVNNSNNDGHALSEFLVDMQ